MKTRKLKLSYPHPELVQGRSVDKYEVVQVTGSTDFVPGQRLTKQDVDGVISRRMWEVTSVKA